MLVHVKSIHPSILCVSRFIFVSALSLVYMGKLEIITTWNSIPGLVGSLTSTYNVPMDTIARGDLGTSTVSLLLFA